MGAARAILEELRRERALAGVAAAAVAALVCVALLAAIWDVPSSDVRNYGLIVAAIIAFPLAIWRSLVAHRQARAGESRRRSPPGRRGSRTTGRRRPACSAPPSCSAATIRPCA